MYYRGRRCEFRSETTRGEHLSCVEDAEDDGAILFLKLFFPEAAQTWLLHRVHVFSGWLAMIEEAADFERVARGLGDHLGDHESSSDESRDEEPHGFSPSDNELEWDLYTSVFEN